jgi:colicin import membrane protein
VLPPEPKQEAKPQVAKREEPKPPLVQQKDAVKTPEPAKPVEKTPVKPEPERVNIEEKKLETKQIEPKPEPPKVVKTEEPKPEAKKVEPKLETKSEQKKTEVKPEVEKVKPGKVEEKKPEPPQPESQTHRVEAKAEKPEAKPEKTETKPQAEKTPVKTTEEKLTATESLPPEERERQIAAALERVKSRVQSQESVARDNPEFSEEAKGSRPITKGEAVGEGGGGAVRGLEFILYTQRLQRRVQESWIVTEKKPGLTASVSFKIQPDGEVQDVELMKSSGDGAFDQSVLRAVRKAAPFPPPPPSYAQEFATQKIVMNFGGEGRVN